MRHVGKYLLLLPTLLVLIAAAPAAEVETRVHDGGKFFKPETIQQADAILEHVQKAYGKDVVVETFESVPESLRTQFEQDRRAFFEKWLRERARHYGVNGVFILICREPGHLQLEPGDQTHTKAFTFKDRDEVVKLIAAAFREKHVDEGLIEGLKEIYRRIGANLGTAPAGPASDATTAPTTRPTTAPAAS